MSIRDDLLKTEAALAVAEQEHIPARRARAVLSKAQIAAFAASLHLNAVTGDLSRLRNVVLHLTDAEALALLNTAIAVVQSKVAPAQLALDTARQSLSAAEAAMVEAQKPFVHLVEKIAELREALRQLEDVVFEPA